MKKSFVIIASIAFIFISCHEKKANEKKSNESIVNDSIMSIEDAKKLLEQNTSSGTSSNYTDHVTISTDEPNFNHKEANQCLTLLTKELDKRKLLYHEKGLVELEADHYDVTDTCYYFRQWGGSADTNIQKVTIGWWMYNPRTHKIKDGITFENLE